MHQYISVALIIFVIFMFLINWKMDKMKVAAINKIPDLLGREKLSAVEIRKRLYADGVSVSIGTLYFVLDILEKDKRVDCVTMPLFIGGQIISHGEYKSRRDSFDDYSSTTPIKRTHASE